MRRRFRNDDPARIAGCTPASRWALVGMRCLNRRGSEEVGRGTRTSPCAPSLRARFSRAGYGYGYGYILGPSPVGPTNLPTRVASVPCRLSCGDAAAPQTVEGHTRPTSLTVMVMVMVLNSAYCTPVPYLATSGVAPAPCSARARPCLDVWWGERFLVQPLTDRQSAHFVARPVRASRARGRRE